jgi:hypothetical protein
MRRNKVRLQSSGFTPQRAAHDLLHFALVQINAGTKHAQTLWAGQTTLKWKLKTSAKRELTGPRGRLIGVGVTINRNLRQREIYEKGI